MGADEVVQVLNRDFLIAPPLSPPPMELYIPTSPNQLHCLSYSRQVLGHCQVKR